MSKTDGSPGVVGYRSPIRMRALSDRLQELELLCTQFEIKSVPIELIGDLVSKDYTENDDMMMVLKRHGLLPSTRA